MSAGLGVTIGVDGALWANGAGAVVTGGGGRVTGGTAGGLLPLTGTGTVWKLLGILGRDDGGGGGGGATIFG